MPASLEEFKKYKNKFDEIIKNIEFVSSHLDGLSIKSVENLYNKSFSVLSEFILKGIASDDFEKLSDEEKVELIEEILENYKNQVKEEKEFLFLSILSYIIINKVFSYEKIFNFEKITPLSFFGTKEAEKEYKNNEQNLIESLEKEEKKVFFQGAYSPSFIFFEAVKNLIGEGDIVFGGDIQSYLISKNKNIYLEQLEK